MALIGNELGASASNQTATMKREIEELSPITCGGVILSGWSEIDESSVTGEVLPQLKGPGDRLIAGSRNGAGRLVVQPDPPQAADRTSGTVPPGIGGIDLAGPFLRPLFRRVLIIDLAAVAAVGIRLITQGQATSIESLTLIVLGLLPPGLFLIWPLQKMALRGWLKTHRLHCSDPARLHDLLNIRRIVFGGAGTVSEGRLSIVSLQPAPAAKPAELIVLAASAYQSVEDIWGKAFLAFGISHRIHLRPAEHVRVEAGLGLSAKVAGKTVLVGRDTWLQQHGIVIEGLDEPIEEHRRLGRQMLFVGIAAPERQCLGVIAFADAPRPGTSSLIRTCKQSQIETFLVGDASKAATATLAGLSGVNGVVSAEDAGKFDDETTLMIARASDLGLLEHYSNAVALGEATLQRLPAVSFGIGRNDTRHVLDFIVLAQLMSRRLPLTLLLVWMTGWPLVAAGLGVLTIPPMLRLACIAAGVIVAVLQSQLLRLVDSLANDGHED